MNTIDVMKQALSVVRSSQEYNMGLSSFVEVVDDLEQAIQQEEANIQTQITKDNLQAAAVTSLECAHCQVTIETLNDKVMRTLAEIEQLKARDLGLDHEPVPVKTYSGGKAWPVQQDQVCPQKICWTPYDCENGRCTGSEKNEPIGRFNGKFRAGDGKMFFEVEVSDEKSLPAVFALIYTTPPAASKPWVELTDEEAQWIYDNSRTPSNMMEMVEAKLKEKNSKG
jgi:hypothetical protein